MDLANKVVNKMIGGDAFSKWLGIKILHISEGYCKLEMRIREEMTNGFNISHGGIAYSLADSCLAFAANSYGKHAITIETKMNYLKKALNNEILIASSEKIKETGKHFESGKLSKYKIIIENQDNDEIADFTGIVYHTGEMWFDKEKCN